MPVRCLIYQQLGDLRVLSNAAVGRQESHESGDWLAMDGRERETAGKRKTKNSTSLADGEKDLAKAKIESERQAKKEQKLRRKEEEAFQRVLLVSKYEAKDKGTLSFFEQEEHRKEEVAHLLNAQTATSSEPTPLLLLGTVASSSTCTSSSTALIARISQGKEECDHNDQVLDRDDLSPFSSFDLSDSTRESGEDQKQESNDSLSALHGPNDSPDVATSNEVTDMPPEEPLQQRISSEMSDAVKQRDLNELEGQYQFNNTMARYINEALSEAPTSAAQEAPIDLEEEKKSDEPDDGVDSVSSGSSHPSGGTFKCISSVELGSQSSGSQKLSSQSSGSTTSSASSSAQGRDFTKEIYSRLMESSDKWASEDDVIVDMKSLSLSETKVSIRSEVIAGIVFESRPVCEVSQLLKVQARNFEKAHKELASDLARIKHDETRKIQQARRLLEQKMRECEDKGRELDSRIKATSLFSDGKDSVSALETALEASDNENRTLKDRVKALEATLKDMVNNGVSSNPLKGKGIAHRIKTEPLHSPPNPARSSLSDSRSSSATSLLSSNNSSSCVESPMVGLEIHRVKRELSPASKDRDENFVPKKPKQNQTPWNMWNSEGIDEAEYWYHGMGQHLIQTKSVDELNYLRRRLTEAQDDFKNLFQKDLPPHEAMLRRNDETHGKYRNLQLDLGIPGTSDRVYSIHFYYGKIVGGINNVLRKRANFRKHPSDDRKIDALIEHLGKNDPDTKAFLVAEKHLRKLNERSPCVTLEFHAAYSKLSLPNAEKPFWLHRAAFKIIRDNVRDRIPMTMSDQDPLYNDCLKQFNNFFYNLHLHEEIAFYERARTFANSQLANKFNGGVPQARN